MNDRNLFKAKRIDNGEWVQGALFDGENHCIIGQEINFSPYVSNECKIIGYEVDRNTLCQCTGLKDENGKLIWENDLVLTPQEDGYSLIRWNDTEARWEMQNETEGIVLDFDNYWANEIVVCGNKIDNPELLEVK